MSLRTKTPLTEQVLSFLSGIEDALDFPRSMRQVVYRHEYEHFKARDRLRSRLQRERKRIRKALWDLEKAEYITLVKREKGNKEYRLSPKGWLKFAFIYSPALKEETRARSSITQGSYVIIFDIPEEHRRFRDVLRGILMNIGCTPLQKSIFGTKSARVTRFIARIIANCELQDRVKILLVKKIL